jgi:zinc transporter ZupT
MSFLPGFLRVVRLGWPEYLAFASLAGILAWGVSAVGVLALVVAVLARLGWLAKLALGFANGTTTRSQPTSGSAPPATA